MGLTELWIIQIWPSINVIINFGCVAQPV
jgi:hypothetical protein